MNGKSIGIARIRMMKAALYGATALMLCASLGATASAQTAGVPADMEETSAEPDILVTGSRIKQPNLKSEAPLQSLSEADFARKGDVLISDALNDLPQFGNALTNAGQSQATANAGFNTGVELINLRNLGVQRTLVLVNGRRHIGGDPGTSSVDLNSIPGSMIKQLDVVTGAASAIYGADAVSGVVNIILKTDFEGLRLGARGGISDRGDAGERQLTALLGSKFADDRGHFVVGAEYYKSDGFLLGDRPYGQLDAINNLQNGLGGSSGIPGGRITGGANGIFIFNSANQLVPAATAPISETFFQRSPIRSQQAANERYIASFNTSYKLVDGDGFTAEAYLESSYANAKTSMQIEPQVIFFQGLPRFGTPFEAPADGPRIPANNPFLLPLIPTIGAIPAAGVQVNRRFSEQGPRFIDVERDTFRILGGVRGNLFGTWTYDGYYQYGNVKSAQTETGVLDRFRLAAAVDVDNNGTPGNLADDRCADPRFVALGCIPLNVFGVGSVSQQFLDYATIPSISLTDAKQTVVSGFVSGEVFNLPAGPVSVVLGAEYRRESSRIDPAPSYLDRSSSVRFLDGADGSYSVTEQFAEVRVPVLKDKPFFKSLAFGAAVRFSDYTTVGNEFSWNVRGDWQVNDAIRIRGTTGTAVRAPNINELFAPVGRANAASFDPCDTVDDFGRPIARTGNRLANCNAQLGALAATLDQTQAQRGTLVSINSGNANLDAEAAFTYTGGVVFTPSGALTGLSLSVDYYNIKIDNVISALAVQDTINQCYDQPNLPAVFCSRVQRDPVNGQLLGVQNQLFNAATEQLSGIDVQFNYGFKPEKVISAIPGRLDLRANYALLLQHDFVARAGAALDDRVGQVGDFRHRFQFGGTYTVSKVSLSLDTRYLSPSVSDTTATGALLANNRIGDYWISDGQIAFNLSDRFSFTLGATNLFDRQPPIVSPPARTSTENVIGGLYDVRGRFVYAGISAKF
ncbi:TonB-dependent receptor plug domain-containing protein [Sphingomonas sp. 28-62-11]|uniref:TonB-dependent receptor plug domain-containing protein n=1 Tax=Sphingomonas sp. 28-62-11 TaxID=1970432 RepID=UPI0035A898D6